MRGVSVASVHQGAGWMVDVGHVGTWIRFVTDIAAENRNDGCIGIIAQDD